MKKIIVFTLIIALVIFNYAKANNQPGDSKVKNLSQINYQNKAVITTEIAALAQNKEDIYSLSVPLIAAAQQGDERLYKNLLTKMNDAMNKTEASTFKTWILGRVLLAADSMNDTNTVQVTQANLANMLRDIDTNIGVSSDLNYAMYTWAYTYLAAIDTNQYFAVRDKMLATAQNLSFIANSSPTSTDTLSNAIWAWVMASQAAANANDKTTYDYILTQIKALQNKSTVKDALESALTRTDSSSDYPAWALAILSLSAASMHDHDTYNELQSAVANSIQTAKDWGNKANQTSANQWKATAEAVLGKLNCELGKVREKAALEDVKESTFSIRRSY